MTKPLQNSVRIAALCTVLGASMPGLQAQPLTNAAAAPATAAATSAATASAAYRDIMAAMQLKHYAEAVQQAETALQIAALAPADKLRLLKAAADAGLHQGSAQLSAALGYYDKIVADPEIANTAKIGILNDRANAQLAALAGGELDAMDLAPMVATLERAMALPGLLPEERAAALNNLAKLYLRADKWPEARRAYDQIGALEVSERTKSEAQRAVADTLVGEGKDAEAEALYRAQGFDLLPLYRRLGETEKWQQASDKLLDDAALPDKIRWEVFSRLPAFSWPYSDRAAMRAAGERYLAGFLQVDPDRALTFLPAFRNAANFNHIVPPDYDFVAWIGPMLMQAPGLRGADYPLVRTSLADALAARGDAAGVKTLAQAAAADDKLNDTVHYWARLVVAEISATDSGQVGSAPVALPAPPKAGSARSEGLLMAAHTLLRAGNDKAANRLYADYRALYGQLPRAAATCTFTDQAPFDAGSWLASPLLKQAGLAAALDRPYGDNLKFLLETDAAVTGRGIEAGAAGAGDNRSELRLACDADGIHIFVMANDDKARQAAAGLVSGGSYEIYLAPGERQAYYTFLVDLPSGKVQPDGFVTMYPNAGFRQALTQDGSFAAETKTVATGYATSLFLSWDLFYDKLPSDGDKWQFDAIRWTRAGGFSFGGEESVHNRSNWGDIVFAGLDAPHLSAIKRNIVFRAAARYKSDKGITGIIGNWADPVLGDAEFYRQKVAPWVASLDELASKVKDDMTAAEVDQVFAAAVPQWMEARYRLAAMRKQYLLQRALAAPQ